jgi:hypothetical protein
MMANDVSAGHPKLSRMSAKWAETMPTVASPQK